MTGVSPRKELQKGANLQVFTVSSKSLRRQGRAMIQRFVVEIDAPFDDPVEVEDVVSALEYGLINQQHRFDVELSVRLHKFQSDGRLVDA